MIKVDWCPICCRGVDGLLTSKTTPKMIELIPCGHLFSLRGGELKKETKMTIANLPTPDEHGNYWFGPEGSTEHPAILPIKRQQGDIGKWMITTKDGVLFDGPDIRAFSTAKEALAELKRRLR